MRNLYQITIENALRIWILNNLGLVFQTYQTVIKNKIRTVKKLEENQVFFKAIEKEKTQIKTKKKSPSNFAATKSNTKPQRTDV